MVKIAVIGAGVVGLSTAVNIQNTIPGAQVTIIADKFERETTSIGAGAIFRPTMKHVKGVSRERLRRWSEDSFRFFSSLALSGKASTSGHTVMPGYIFSKEKIEDPLYADIVYHHRELTTEEIDKLNMSKYKYGYSLCSIITLMPKYLVWLMNKFISNGGFTEKRRLESLHELFGHYDVVVNCTAMGSRELVNDKTIYPVRGQLVKVNAPWIKFWMFTDDDAYILPTPDFVAVGGVKQKNESSLEINPQDRIGILERCHRLWPPLKGSTIIDEWVGLRPTRIPPRVEMEVIKLAKGNLKVVHNYGHGSNGVALSWGTAIEAAGYVKDMLFRQSRL